MMSTRPEINVVQDRSNTHDWRVEAINTDGEGACEVAVFSGPDSKGRAMRFAGVEYGYAPE